MRNFVSVAFTFFVLIIVSNTLFVIKETERAVMLQFGQVVNSDIQPGLHWKIPWVNTVRAVSYTHLTLPTILLV